MKTKMIMLCLLLGSWGANAQQAKFKDAKIGTAYESYSRLKDALVASNNEDAKKGAGDLKNALTEAKGSAASIELASKIASADLKEQRKLFSKLSDESC